MAQFHNTIQTMGVRRQDQAFFARLGARIAERRRAQGLTQSQLAEQLGVSQPAVNGYETGTRRLPLSTLPILTKALGVCTDDLIGETPVKRKRGPTPKLQQQLEQLGRLPRSKQRFVSEMLDTVLKQAN